MKRSAHHQWLLMVVTLAVAAGGQISRSHAADHTVIASGLAPIIGGDIPQARDEALNDARIKAVEQVVGAMVSSQTVLHNELLLAAELYTEAAGFVKEYAVVEEAVVEPGMYRVQIRATVSDNLLEDELVKLVKEDRVIVVADEYDQGQPARGQILHGKVVAELTRAGFENIISPQHRPPGSPAALTEAHAGGPDLLRAARATGLYYLADVVVTGRSDARQSTRIRDDFYSAHAGGFLRVCRVSDNTCLAAAERHTVRGFGSSAAAAATDAREKLADGLIQEVLRTIVPGHYKSIKIVFHGIPTFADYETYIRLLQLMRWVGRVRPDSTGYHPRTSVLEVYYAHDPHFLAARLNARAELEVIATSSNKIEITHIK